MQLCYKSSSTFQQLARLASASLRFKTTVLLALMPSSLSGYSVQFLRGAMSAHSESSSALSQAEKVGATDSPLLTRKRRWGIAEINYSAANEYVKSHYGINRYFGHTPDDGRIAEVVYDARHGISDDEGVVSPASLRRCGFELRNAPTTVNNYGELDEIRKVYVPEISDIIKSALEVDGDVVERLVFWHPMLRGTGSLMSRINSTGIVPTAPVAALAHIDTDVGAYPSVEGFVRLVCNNRLDKLSNIDDEYFVEALRTGRRFAVLNAWRNVGDGEVQRDPLGLLATRYDHSGPGYFPGSSPDPVRSCWYAFPSMKPDELLLFKQYDRDFSFPSDIWHCALSSCSISEVTSNRNDVTPRKSFDIRAFVLFRENVQLGLDRYAMERPKSLLSLEESGCFCDEQARTRGS